MPRRASLVRSRRAVRTAFVAIVLLVAPHVARAESWATAQAAELTRQGRDHVAQGDVDVAVKRFNEAIELDATYGPAYLGLGAARERGGDAAEAERAYSMGIEHVNGFVEGHLSRAHLRQKQHRAEEALLDLTAAADLRPEDLAVLGQLRAAFVASLALPAALGVARRMIAVATAHDDDKALTEARVGAKALAALVREIDPVSAGIVGRGPVRRSIALAARR